MEIIKPGILPQHYSLSDAAEVLAVDASVILKALAQLPEMRRRYGTWTIEDLSAIDDVVKAMVARRGQR